MVHVPFHMDRPVVSISGTINRQTVDVSFVMQRHGPTLHRMQSIVKRFDVQSTDKVDDAPLVVQSQVATGQQGDVLVVPHQQGPMINGGGNSIERHRQGDCSSIPCGADNYRSMSASFSAERGGESRGAAESYSHGTSCSENRCDATCAVY